MRFWILTSSVLAITGGVMFLVLPVAFFNGTVSIVQRLASSSGPSYGYGHIIEVYRPTSLPIEMVAFSGILGGVGILLGLLVLVMHAGPRRYLTWGLPFSLGSESLLFWIVSIYVKGGYGTSPAIYSVFQPLAIISMAGATLLLTLGLAMSSIQGRSMLMIAYEKLGMSSRREKTLSTAALFQLFGF